jgi:hypothetical protein
LPSSRLISAEKLDRNVAWFFSNALICLRSVFPEIYNHCKDNLIMWNTVESVKTNLNIPLFLRLTLLLHDLKIYSQISWYPDKGFELILNSGKYIFIPL